MQVSKDVNTGKALLIIFGWWFFILILISIFDFDVWITGSNISGWHWLLLPLAVWVINLFAKDTKEDKWALQPTQAENKLDVDSDEIVINRSDVNASVMRVHQGLYHCKNWLRTKISLKNYPQVEEWLWILISDYTDEMSMPTPRINPNVLAATIALMKYFLELLYVYIKKKWPIDWYQAVRLCISVHVMFREALANGKSNLPDVLSNEVFTKLAGIDLSDIEGWIEEEYEKWWLSQFPSNKTSKK